MIFVSVSVLKSTAPFERLDVSSDYEGETGCFLAHASSIIYIAYILLGLSETSAYSDLGCVSRQLSVLRRDLLGFLR